MEWTLKRLQETSLKGGVLNGGTPNQDPTSVWDSKLTRPLTRWRWETRNPDSKRPPVEIMSLMKLGFS